MVVTSASLTQLAADLRGLAGVLADVQSQGGAVTDALAANVEAMPPLWHGPRADAVLGAGEDYHATVVGHGPVVGWPLQVSSVREIIGQWATSADDFADYLRGPERTMATDQLTPEDAEDHDRASTRITELQAGWQRTCVTYAAEIDTYRAPLTTAIDSMMFPGDFPYPPLEGSQYSGLVYDFALMASMPISMVDPSGQLDEERQARLDGLFNSEMGNLVFTIIETSNEEDLGERDEHWTDDDLLAASDPDRVRAYISQIYVDSGEPLDEESLDLLVDETVATALAIRAGRSDDWKDRDEDLGYFEHGFGEWLREDFAGPATAFVTTVGCMAIVTTASGGTLSAPAAGGCAAAGSAAGDAVGAWANGAGFVDGLQSIDPTRAAVSFVTAWGTQGLINRFLPSSATPTGIAAARQAGLEGEALAGINPALKVRIESVTGSAAYRVPDAITATTLTEVKNVTNLSLTSQIEDFLLYSQREGMSFNLIVRSNTSLSGPLQTLVDSGQINLIRMLPP